MIQFVRIGNILTKAVIIAKGTHQNTAKRSKFVTIACTWIGQIFYWSTIGSNSIACLRICCVSQWWHLMPNGSPLDHRLRRVWRSFNSPQMNASICWTRLPLILIWMHGIGWPSRFSTIAKFWKSVSLKGFFWRKFPFSYGNWHFPLEFHIFLWKFKFSYGNSHFSMDIGIFQGKFAFSYNKLAFFFMLTAFSTKIGIYPLLISFPSILSVVRHANVPKTDANNQLISSGITLVFRFAAIPGSHRSGTRIQISVSR